tara:strand:+ start:648 stop:1244 length:597 start_codon:yes stop_codon:yes gene_type:complete
MIKFKKLNLDEPYIKFKEDYNLALNNNQKFIEAVTISSYSKSIDEVNSRMVNIKFVDNTDFIFFSNYNSPKSKEFIEHNQINAMFFWDSINVQIRLKAKIRKTSNQFNQEYFSSRSKLKNALAISSNQSEYIDSYESVINKYNKSLKSDKLNECPDYWGGFLFTPYYFEFWKGHESRLNKRDIYEMREGKWQHYFLQP